LGDLLSAEPNIADLLQTEHPEIVAGRGIDKSMRKVAFGVQNLYL